MPLDKLSKSPALSVLPIGTPGLPVSSIPSGLIRVDDHTRATPARAVLPLQSNYSAENAQRPTAVVYCEANFGALDGKTANGLVRHSERYQILAIIDSEKSGLDAGEVLDGTSNGIPICSDLADSIAYTGIVPDYFIYGIAPSSGILTPLERGLVLEAISSGIHIVSGLHEFLGDDPEFVAASASSNVTIRDVRKPRAKKDLRLFNGRIAEVTCPVIAVLGTDCAIGKRTTATILTNALNLRGLSAVMIGTGQTGLIQGARYGVGLDAVPSQFCTGELEATIVEAFEFEQPDVIVIEGQGSLSHPAFSTTSMILRGSCPDGVVLQHAPKRSQGEPEETNAAGVLRQQSGRRVCLLQGFPQGDRCPEPWPLQLWPFAEHPWQAWRRARFEASEAKRRGAFR